MTRLAKLLLASMLAVGGGSVSASAADMVAVHYSDPGICAQSAVLNRITNRFSYQVRHVPNLPQVSIVDFHGIGETRYLPQIKNVRPIDRRYCYAKAQLSNGLTHDVWYLIEKPMGFAGVGSNVEFCVSGFDRWHVYGGRCRTVR
ncbi:hypothetical protein [Aquamicrobium zhengzhouense]|uniref:Uncharacterized protein n=1 Tax=Aquamicrobium zhengzhouense TaxID=2781738 RepID=A0ABS0SAH9_9HYPH|nr:hypothetical protein [Aquamicrobium zhengzhouense]MBI1620293.1 hypothetical protein [Aquamicrobium zhengzhouense]